MIEYERSRRELQMFLKEHGVEHFTAAEVAQVDVPPTHMWPFILPTLRVASEVRKWEEVRFVIVTSGYRSRKHNERVGGAPSSLHMRFNALDIIPVPADRELDVFRPTDLQRFRDRIEDSQLGPFMGIGLYETFLHIDTRRLFFNMPSARW